MRACASDVQDRYATAEDVQIGATDRDSVRHARPRR